MGVPVGQVRLLDANDVLAVVTPAAAIRAVRAALAQLYAGEVVAPAPLSLRFPSHEGEMHAKGAYIAGDEFFAVKTVTGFYHNAALGLPVVDGMSMVHSAETGELAYLVLDHGLLTELRTGAAGAIAADLLATPETPRVAVVGAGRQARCQLRALLEVRRPNEVALYARRRAQAVELANELSETIAPDITVAVADSVAAAVRGAAVVVTTTTARRPIIEAGWIGPGTHVTAVGSDEPDKNELEPALLAAADKVVVDDTASCLASGELHHAVASGAMTPEQVYGELAALIAKEKPGREHASEITVADLTGLGVEDTAVASLLATVARERSLGRILDIPDQARFTTGS